MKEIINATGFFKDQYTRFRKSVNDKDLKCFAALKNDVDRWRFVKDKNKLEFPTKVDDAGGKNLDQAIKLKNEGNKSFQEGKYANALSLYSQSLIAFPSDVDKTEFSIIKANRSAALYHLEEFDACLVDIEDSLALGYPKHLHHKILDRKARCLMGLKQNQTAISALRKTLQALDDAKMAADVRQKKQQDIQIMLGLLAQKKAVDEKIKPKEFTSSIEGEKSGKYKAASRAVTFGYSESEGRFAQAAGKIQSGNVILREKAHCAVLLQENSTTHCFQCMRRSYFTEPCPTCTLVRFCSAQCRNVACNTHHKYECKILKTLWESGASITCLMAVRIVTQKPLSYFQDFAKRLEAAEQLSLEKGYDGSDYLTVYNLVKHGDKRATEDMFHRTYMAVFLHECLKRTGYFNDSDEADTQRDEELIASLILRHLQSLQFNAHEISEMIFHSTDPKSWKSVFVGGGLFPTLALFNHSCEPSIIRYFEGSKVVVRAIKNINPGEHIAENYGPIFTQTPRKERQTTLKTQYWFDCGCEPCTRNWPTLEQMDAATMRFHCDNKECDNVVVVPVNVMSFMVPCNKCGTQTNILKGLKVLQDTENLFKLGENFLESGDIMKALKKFLELQSLLSDTLVPPFRDFYLCQQNVRNCLMALGNTHPPMSKFVKRLK